MLKPNGTLWLNLGDSYAGGARGGYVGSKSTLNGSTKGRDQTKVARGSQKAASSHDKIRLAGTLTRAWVSAPKGMKQKDLMMMPARVAIALQEDGWWLRSEIVWHKPNQMPESVTDRPTCAHEKVFLLTGKAKYFYDAAAIREPLSQSTLERLARADNDHQSSVRANGGTRADRLMRPVARLPVPAAWDNGDGHHGTIHSQGRRKRGVPPYHAQSMADHQTTAARDLTDGEITEMARKSRFARDLDAHDERWRMARRRPPRLPPGAGAAGAEACQPKTPAGGAAVTGR